MGSTAQNQKGHVKNSEFLGYDADILHILQSAAVSMGISITKEEKIRKISLISNCFSQS